VVKVMEADIGKIGLSPRSHLPGSQSSPPKFLYNNNIIILSKIEVAVSKQLSFQFYSDQVEAKNDGAKV